MRSIYLVQVFLPLVDNAEQPLPRELFDTVAQELTGRFGGLTAYTRAPAEGHWKPGESEHRRDDIVIYEVMVDQLDPPWWTNYRQALEARFRQTEVVVRAQRIEIF